MNATANKPETHKPARRGFPSLPCILCGNANGAVTVSLEDLGQFHCNECDEHFNADAVRQQLSQWQAVLTWCDQAPAVSE
ncbi:MAG TPA: hypothetical protein VMG10_32785 [Gemmataceae bacterium]|nr:hypothetical protein [Gemmataceae bacterium]